MFRIAILDPTKNKPYGDLFVYYSRLRLFYITDTVYWREKTSYMGLAPELPIKDQLLLTIRHYLTAIKGKLGQLLPGQYLFCPFELYDETFEGFFISKKENDKLCLQSGWVDHFEYASKTLEAFIDSVDNVHWRHAPQAVSQTIFEEELEHCINHLEVIQPEKLAWIMDAFGARIR